jgi:methionine-S-sulfoxide reductase
MGIAMKQRLSILGTFLALIVLVSCASKGGGTDSHDDKATAPAALDTARLSDPRYRKATFAGGCFWCMQPPFDTVKGVIGTVVGFTGGAEKDPTYPMVSAGGTGHAESIEITYDPAVVSYDYLLDIYWHNIDPTTLDREFADVGHQYRTAIFYHDDEQHRQAVSSREKYERMGVFGAPIVTEITEASQFYPAEEYHQEYYKKNYQDYKRYRIGSGREGYLEKLWGGGH